jgi:hypothetical protein
VSSRFTEIFSLRYSQFSGQGGAEELSERRFPRNRFLRFVDLADVFRGATAVNEYRTINACWLAKMNKIDIGPTG